MCAPIGRTLATDDTFCIGMNWRLVHSLNVNGGQRGLSRDESGRYGRESHVPQRRTTGSRSCREADGDRAAIVSRGSHVPPGRSGEPVARQRAVGETGQKCRRVQGRVMRQSSLIPKAMTCFLWKAECVEMRLLGLGRGQQKRSERNLAGALLRSGRGGGKRAARYVSRLLHPTCAPVRTGTPSKPCLCSVIRRGVSTTVGRSPT